MDIDSLNIDKSKWVLTPMGDLADEISKRVDNPSDSDYEKFVGLEHFVSGDLKIRQWGSTENLTSSTKAFESGDILFARRNAYLKRASLVSFDGVCSGDAFVLRENHEKVVPGFLAFVVNSNALWEFANANAAGTMSKRVKWRDLAEFEFLLPPKDQQSEIAELLWAIDDLIQQDKKLLELARVQYQASMNRLVLNGFSDSSKTSENLKQEIASEWHETTIGDLLKDSFIEKIQDGNHGEIHPKSSDYTEEGIPFVMANTLSNGSICFDSTKKLPKDITDKLRIGFSYPGDVLLSHKGTVGQVAVVPDNIEWPYLMMTPQVTLYRVNKDKFLPKFLYYVLTSAYFQHQLKRLSSQSTRAYVGITSQRSLKVVIPSTLSEQRQVVNALDVMTLNIFSIENKIKHSENLQKSLINQLL